MKTCNECHADKPLDAFAPKRGVCKSCRLTLDTKRRERLRALNPPKPEDFDAIPAHDYTDDDRAWQSARLPVFNRGLLTWRIAV